MLGGFFFKSETDPKTLGDDDFTVEAITTETGTQIPLGVAQAVPEPPVLPLMLVGLLGLALQPKRFREA